MSYHTWMICQYTEKLNVWEYTQEVASITQNIGFKANQDKTQVQSKVKYSVIVLGQRNGHAGISKG